MTGIRRCGKSVMLELIKEELVESGVSPAQFISINFEDLNCAHLQTAKALHDEITMKAADIPGKVYLFFDEIQEVKDWEKCINSLRVSLDCDIYITGSNAKLLSGELSTYLSGRYVEFVIYPFSFAEFLELYRPIAPETRRSTLYVTRAERNCMFRLPIYWHPMRPSGVSSERMTTSAISCWQRNGIKWKRELEYHSNFFPQSASLNPTSTKSSPIISGRFTSMPSEDSN